MLDIQWKWESDISLVYFYVDGEEFTAWYCEENPMGAFEEFCKTIELGRSALETENQALRNELEALRGDALRLGKLIENGLVCSVCGGGGFIGNPPDDYQDCPECKKSINKIKADAVLSIMGLDYDCETANGDSAWSSNTIEEHANKLEQDNAHN